MYGSEEAETPPDFLDADIADAIVRLAALTGIPLTETARIEAYELAETIYSYVMEGP